MRWFIFSYLMIKLAVKYKSVYKYMRWCIFSCLMIKLTVKKVIIFCMIS